MIDVLLWIFDTSSKVNEVRKQMSNISSNVTSLPQMRWNNGYLWRSICYVGFQFILCTSILSEHDPLSFLSFLIFEKRWKFSRIFFWRLKKFHKVSQSDSYSLYTAPYHHKILSFIVLLYVQFDKIVRLTFNSDRNCQIDMQVFFWKLMFEKKNL